MLGRVKLRAYGLEPRSAPVRDSRWSAAVAALTLAVLVVAPLLGIFHRASVRHAVCEHGDLIEPDRGSTSRVEDDSDGEPSRTVAVREDSSPSVHGHSHCAAGILAKSDRGVVAPAVAATFAVWTPAAPFSCGEAAYTRPALASAPKTSPPVHARPVA